MATSQPGGNTDGGKVRVRYMVAAVEPAVAFYVQHLGFEVKPGATRNFAMLSRGNLDLVLSTPFGPGGAAKPMLDGRKVNLEGGIASFSTWTISRAKLIGCGRLGSGFATMSQKVPVARRSCWTIHPGIRSNYSNPPTERG
jgi:hypothetical protein